MTRIEFFLSTSLNQTIQEMEMEEKLKETKFTKDIEDMVQSLLSTHQSNQFYKKLLCLVRWSLRDLLCPRRTFLRDKVFALQILTSIFLRKIKISNFWRNLSAR
jgi:hypothetical protein